jgi:hypothetical protein
MGDAGHHGSGPPPGWLRDRALRGHAQPDDYWAPRVAGVVPLALPPRQVHTARLVLITLASFAQPGPDPGTLVAGVGQRLLADRCGVFRSTLADALTHLTDVGAVALEPTAARARSVYRLTFWEWFETERGPVAGRVTGPVAGPVAGPVGRATGTGTRTRLGREGTRANVAGQAPVPGGADHPPPTKSEFSKPNPTEPDPGCPRHGWETHGVDPCGGCRDANQRKAGHAEQARAALEAERATYAATVAVAGWCGHDGYLDPGGNVPQPRGYGPKCVDCRTAWKRDHAPAPKPRERIAADVIPVAGLVLGSLPALQIAG